MTAKKSLVPGLIPVPEKHRRAWLLASTRETSELMRQALYLVALGLPPWKASVLAGYKSPEGSAKNVYAKAKHYNLYQPSSEQIADQAREITHSSGEQVLDRIGCRKLADRNLIEVWARSQSVSAKREALQKQPQDDAYGSSLDRLVHQVLHAGGSFQLTVSAPGEELEPDVIDVTPKSPLDPDVDPVATRLPHESPNENEHEPEP